MTFSDREIKPEELQEIYRDFEAIERRDGVPDANIRRLQYIAEENGEVVGFVSGLTNHRWFYLSDLWVREDHRGKGLGSRLLAQMETRVFMKSTGIPFLLYLKIFLKFPVIIISVIGRIYKLSAGVPAERKQIL